MNKNDETKSALQQVDERRRGFLGKLLAGGVAAAALPTMSTVALGQDRQPGGKGKGGGAQGKGGFGGGKGKGGGGRPEPAQMAARLIQMHDKDGDGALNAKELTAALQAMMSRRGGQGGGGFGGGAGKGKGGGFGGGEGKGKGAGGGQGGVRPQRPGGQ